MRAGDGSTDSLLDPQHTFPGPGDYWVCLTVSIDTCGPVQICDSIHLVQPIGLDEGRASQFSAVPNPASAEVVFNNPSLEGVTFGLFTGLGTLVFEEFLEQNQSIFWDLSGFASGIYFVRWQTENGRVFSQKLVISH